MRARGISFEISSLISMAKFRRIKGILCQNDTSLKWNLSGLFSDPLQRFLKPNQVGLNRGEFA